MVAREETGAVAVVALLAALEAERVRQLREAARKVAERMVAIEKLLAKGAA